MAIALNHLATTGSTTDTNVYTTASLSPTANRLILAWFGNTRVLTDATSPTIGGTLGLTWSLISENHWSTSACDAAEHFNSKLSLWAADTGGSPGSGTIEWTFGGNTQLCGRWSVYELSGTDLGASTVSQCFVQTVNSSACPTAATSMSLSLAAAGASDNRPFF